MTVREAVGRFDLLYPNAMPYAEKLRVLSALDGRLYTELLCRLKDPPAGFAGYSSDTPGDTELLAPFPYDDLYIKALCAENDAVNGDITRYNNAAALFNAAWERLASYLNRTRGGAGPAGYDYGT